LGIQFDSDTFIYCSFGILIGFQAVVFSFLSRVYATREGLYPETTTFSRILKYITMERGLIIGAATYAVGLLAIIHTIFDWKQHHFGTMNLSNLIRWVVPAATSTALGIELILFSFFFSTLQLGVRHGATRYQEGLSYRRAEHRDPEAA
jgi:hypothetical protein